jgi:hypothetical protein
MLCLAQQNWIDLVQNRSLEFEGNLKGSVQWELYSALGNEGVKQTLLVCPETRGWGMEFECQNGWISVRNQYIAR